MTDNEAVKWGGGVFAWESVVTIEGASRVTRNTALLGGGIYLLGEKARLDAGGRRSGGGGGGGEILGGGGGDGGGGGGQAGPPE